MLEFAAVIAALSFLKPPIINIIKMLWIMNINNEEVRKSVILLVTFIIGVILSIGVNLVGGFAVPILEVILIGGGISLGGSQLSHRAGKLFKNGI